MKYKIIKTYDLEELEDLVNEMCDYEWEPIGNVSVGVESKVSTISGRRYYNHFFVQAMILKEGAVYGK